MVVEVVNKGPLLGIRHLQIFLLFFGITVNYVVKLNTSVAVVAMTNAESSNPNFDEYDWDNKHISYILSSFFWGYTITQFPGGYLCRWLGTKRTMFISTLGSSIFSVITPFCIPFGGWQLYCGIRVVQGLFQGLLFPSIHGYLASWCPLEERNKLGAFSQTGIECGTLLAMALSGMLASSNLGWPGISYVSGGLGFVWCACWMVFASNTASESRWISVEERKYIEASVSGKNIKDGEKRIPVPWKALLTSLPFWALLVVRSAESWGFSTLQAEIPSYMNGVLWMDIKKNALYSSLPYLAMWLMSYVYLIVSEVILNHKWLTLTQLRRTYNSIAFWIPAMGLIGIGFLGEDEKTLAITLMIIVVGLNSGATIGSTLNTIDLSPNHAAVQMGIINTAANLAALITPLLAGVIITDEHDRAQWQIVFAISAGIFVLGNLFYIIFGSTKEQTWNDENFLASDKETGDVRKNSIKV